MHFVLAARLTAQLLAGRRVREPVAVAERVLSVQAQDARGVRLAIRARTTGVRAADVDRALTEERSLIVSWLNRGTLHLVRSEDYPWLQALMTPLLLARNAARLAQLGVTPTLAERGVRVVERSLAEKGPLTRRQLGERLEAAGVPTARQALVHVLMLACLRGIAVRGPVCGREQAYVLVHDWLGPAPGVERPRALAELARRYLAGHGPASDRDLARWSGLPLRDARAGLQAIARELVERAEGSMDLAHRPRPARLPPPRLLGAFDPILHGWRSRELVLGRQEARVVSGGLFRPFALVRGRAVASWAIRADAVELEAFEPLRPEDAAALASDAAAALRFLGLVVGEQPAQRAVERPPRGRTERP